MRCSHSEVLNFYKEMPFNLREGVDSQVAAVTKRNLVAEYPVLPPLLRQGATVLDVGCGTGWLSNSIAYYYKSDVLGLDFNPVAIERAAAVAQKLQLKAKFLVQDLFFFQPEQPVDVVVSIGVLHHTHDCLGALKLICSSWVKQGGRGGGGSVPPVRAATLFGIFCRPEAARSFGRRIIRSLCRAEPPHQRPDPVAVVVSGSGAAPP